MYFSIKLSIHGPFPNGLGYKLRPRFQTTIFGEEGGLSARLYGTNIIASLMENFWFIFFYFLSSSAMQQRGQWNIQHQECGTAKPVYQVIYGKTTILSKVVNTVNRALEEEALFSVERRSP